MSKDGLFIPSSARTYRDLVKLETYNVELTQDECCVLLKIHDYGVDSITDDEKIILHSITLNLKYSLNKFK